MSFLEKIAAEKRSSFQFEKKSLIETVRTAKDVALISEIKRKSPSQGDIRKLDAASTAMEMESSGASAISVLTEENYFAGSLRDLENVKRNVSIPVLRKDFIVEEGELFESALHGADAILLIAAILKDETEHFVDRAHEIGLECLVEVHSERDLVYALDSSAMLIGVNNRDLATLKVDLSTTEKIVQLIPNNRLIVAESGIHTREDVVRMRDAGAKACLIGTSIMKSNSISQKIRELSGK